jgi:hypothetical protein
MTTARIEELLEILPPEAPYLARFSRDLREPHIPAEVYVCAEACNDPAFGSKFLESFLKLGRPLPDSVIEQEFRRVYSYACGQSEDQDAREALALEHPRNMHRRILVRCLLLRDEFDFVQIAQKAGLSEDAVRMYESLFWSVRGRDRIYVTSLVYPESRQETPMNLALRATVQEGISAAEELLGLKNPVEDSGASGHAHAIAGRILSNANFLTKLGFLNQELPATKSALSVLRAFKLERGQQPDTTSERQVGQMSASMAVALSIGRSLEVGSSVFGIGKQSPAFETAKRTRSRRLKRASARQRPPAHLLNAA